MMQPGQGNKKSGMENWLFNETVLGKTLFRLSALCRASDDEQYRFLGGNLIVLDRRIDPAH